jgi:hypothetical protein
MSYRINRTDGELIIDLIDGIIDTTSTDITLIGRNYKGFGEWINENFIKLLENFASTASPTNPLTGQLWFDKQDQKLKVFDGTSFRPASGTIVNSSQPSNLTAGDIWIDNENNRLYLYDGTDLTLVGPTYDAGQGKTGFESASQIDERNITTTILKLFLGGVLVGIYSPAEIIVPIQFAITGFHTWAEDTQNPKRQKLYKGFNIADVENETGINGFWWRGTSLNSKYLLDDQGNQKTSVNFLPADGNGETTGFITIKNSKGLTIGVGDRPFVNAKIFGSTTYIDMLESNADFGIRIKNAQYTNSFVNAIYIDTSEYKIKMFDGLGQFENLVSVPELDLYGNLTVAGSVSIAGSLSVSGDVTYVTSQDLKIIDKTIELAIGEQDQIGSNADVEGGGFILRSNEGDKDFVWKLDTDIVNDTPVGSWTSNQNINLSVSGINANPSYRINGEMVLSSSELHSGVTRATGLTQLGTLTELSVDNIYIDSASITRINGAGITINPNGGSLSLSNNKISNLATPIANDEAANKEYVDRAVDGKEILLSLDINGLIASGDPDYTPFYASTIQNVRSVLNNMLPIEESLPGQNVKIMATRIRQITAVFPITVSEEDTAVLQKSRVTVRNFDNTGTVAVVQDIVANPAYAGSTTEIEFTVDRFIYRFQSDGANWNSTGVDRIVV